MKVRKRRSPEQAAQLLQQMEKDIANGKTIAECCMEAQITRMTYSNWRKKYSGVQDIRALRIKQLEQENANLRRLVSELSLQKLVLRDIMASGGLLKP